MKRGLAGPGSLQLGRPGSRPATCRLEALGPLAWFTLEKPSCCKQHLALGLSMEVQKEVGKLEVLRSSEKYSERSHVVGGCQSLPPFGMQHL